MRCLFLVWRLCGRIAHSLKALNISTKKMVASLLKVISSGLQDERLSFRSTLFPFQKVWNKAGRFTTRWERLDFENTPSFGQTGFFRILRKGNLVTRLYLVAQMPDIYTPQRLAAAAAGAPAAGVPAGTAATAGQAMAGGAGAGRAAAHGGRDGLAPPRPRRTRSAP